MAYFKSNKVETRIANILKGTSNPASSIGENGQLYLKYADISNMYSLREYIEVGNSSGPYINTGLFWASTNEFEVKAQFMAEPDWDSFVFGCWVSYMDTNIAYGNGWQIMVGGSGISGQQYDTNAHIYKAEQNAILYDGTTIGSAPNWNNVPTNVPIAIFTDGARLTEKRIKNTRIYYAKIWDNGELTHYFVPAIRKSDNEIGMLDVITATFYENDGSGSFEISSTEITDISGKPIGSAFAKVNGQWQDLIGTNIDDILAGGSKYIKATGSFTSASSGGQKVEVNCGFKPDLVMVDMEFGNGFTRATYLSTAWYEETDHPISVWDLRPMENVIYAITPGSVDGETGITDLTDTGFKYRSNGGNTLDKACTYTAIKFDAEPEPTISIIDASTITKYHESSMTVCSDVSDIIFNWDGSQSIGANVHITNPIDVTDLSTLKYELKTLSCYGNGSQAQQVRWNVMVGLMQTAPSGIINAEYSQAGFVAGNDFAYSNTDYGTQTIDVSALSGNYYFVVVAHGWNASVSDLRCT